MPELPEVETVARDLRPRIVGATIVGARCSWARTLRTHTPEAFAEAVAGRRVETVGRRAKLVVVELSGDAALTIHLKMTGQLFVVPADVPVDPYVRLVLELADGRELRFRDIRKFGRVGPVRPRSGHGRARDGGRRFVGLRRSSGRSRSIRPSRSATSVAGSGAGRDASSRSCSTSRSSPGSATSTRTRRCGPLGSTRCARRRRSARRTSGTCTRPSARSWPRPSSDAAAPSTTTRRPTATGRCRSASRSTSGPASRARAAGGRSSGSSSAPGPRTSARGASACRRRIAPARRRSCGRRPAATSDAVAAGPSWTGRGASAGRPPRRSRPRAAAGRNGRSAPPRPVGPPHATAWRRGA